MEKQVSLFRHLSLTCLTSLQSVEQLLQHLAKVAPPTHYLALQVTKKRNVVPSLKMDKAQAKKALVSLIPNTDDIDDNLLKRKVIIAINLSMILMLRTEVITSIMNICRVGIY